MFRPFSFLFQIVGDIAVAVKKHKRYSLFIGKIKLIKGSKIELDTPSHTETITLIKNYFQNLPTSSKKHLLRNQTTRTAVQQLINDYGKFKTI